MLAKEMTNKELKIKQCKKQRKLLIPNKVVIQKLFTIPISNWLKERQYNWMFRIETRITIVCVCIYRVRVRPMFLARRFAGLPF